MEYFGTYLRRKTGELSRGYKYAFGGNEKF